jgi:hypothetical protein
MRNEFLDGDTLFAVAVAGAIGLGAANLAIQVNKERAAFDASAASQKLGQLAYPPPSLGAADTHADEPAGPLNF